MAWLEREREIQNSWRQSLFNNYFTHYCPISRSKDNQTMKLGELIEKNFFKNYAENEAGRLVPDLFHHF